MTHSTTPAPGSIRRHWLYLLCKTVLYISISIARSVLFFPLYWCRGFAQMVFGYISMGCFLSFIMILVGYTGEQRTFLIMIMGISWIASVLLSWFYDSLVLTLCPKDSRLYLYNA